MSEMESNAAEAGDFKGNYDPHRYYGNQVDDVTEFVVLGQKDWVDKGKKGILQKDKMFKICIIGATGAVGRKVVDACNRNPQVEEISLIVRRRLSYWRCGSTNPYKNGKMHFIIKENFDDLSTVDGEMHFHEAK